MKKIICALALAVTFVSCKTGSFPATATNAVSVNIDLINVKEDKVLVTIMPPKITTEEVVYSIPKTVPGTYSIDNYGKYSNDFKAFDSKGNALEVKRLDDNSWSVSKAKSLTKITYWVEDTFDTEKGTGFGNDDIFSPAGTNIDAGKNFMINTHGFVGYFQDKLDVPYKLTITHPETLWGATSMTDEDASNTSDVFITPRYAVLVENPIMYAQPDYTTFNVNGMDILISVYSPTGKFTAESITPEMKTMMTAQKNFLGKVDATKKYTVLLYLSTLAKEDAHGFGALEHPTSTTVVLPESLPKDKLVESMQDVVSHEFFHIVTPLTIHSKEIQYFDYNAPQMSEHLWLYEGVTEYFANLFQINQGLIDEADFYSRMADKIEQSKGLDDAMSFTVMSKNVLSQPYKDQYLNVYQKGALIGMCIDIIIREKSNGERGILDLMHQLSQEYGVEKPFNDHELFDEIRKMTYPEVGEFLKNHVSGTAPIPYAEYLAKVGVTKETEKKVAPIFLKGQTPYIGIDQRSKQISVRSDIELNAFFNNLNLKPGDVLLSINNKKYNLDNIYELLTESESWKENDPITVAIVRNGKEQTINGIVKLPYEESETFIASDSSKDQLKNAWLKS